MWHKKVDKVYVLNLDKRTDRLIDFYVGIEELGFDVERKRAVEHSKGAVGLMYTMLELFNEVLSRGYENILVFEDDAYVVDGVDFNATMDAAIEQLPPNYDMLFLGCQPSKGYECFYSKNLLPVKHAYSTHAVLYSKKGINMILASSLSEPIDNHYVDHIQPSGDCYQIFPFLCGQRAGYSDIGKSEISWDYYLKRKHDEEILKLKQRGIYQP